MVDRVLVAMDASEMGERTLQYALEAHPEAAITVIHVVGEPSSMWGKAAGLALSEDIESEVDDLAEAVFETAHRIADEHGVEITTETELGHPVRAILERADAYDVVAIGTHAGTVAERLFVGNVAEKVVRQSPVPVTVVR